MKTRSRLLATALVAMSLSGLAVAAPVSAADTSIDLGRFTVRDNGRSVDWRVSFRCNRGDVYRADIELTQRNDRREASGDARSDRIRCDGDRQTVTLNIRADDGRFRSGRARADVVVSSRNNGDWNRNEGGWGDDDKRGGGNGNHNGDNRNRDYHVTQWVNLRGGGDHH